MLLRLSDRGEKTESASHASRCPRAPLDGPQTGWVGRSKFADEGSWLAACTRRAGPPGQKRRPKTTRTKGMGTSRRVRFPRTGSPRLGPFLADDGPTVGQEDVVQYHGGGGPGPVCTSPGSSLPPYARAFTMVVGRTSISVGVRAEMNVECG